LLEWYREGGREKRRTRDAPNLQHGEKHHKLIERSHTR
jgi:hypothetical protein